MRYSCIAQGASPGLINETHLLSPFRGGTSETQDKCSRYSVAPTELDITFRSCLPRVSYRALPSFHPGLCRSVVPTALIMRLNFDALVLGRASIQEKRDFVIV